MQETKVEVRNETQPVNLREAEQRFKSSFDNAEYQRWCEKLRNRSKGKLHGAPTMPGNSHITGRRIFHRPAAS
jgi:hypothetical protein